MFPARCRQMLPNGRAPPICGHQPPFLQTTQTSLGSCAIQPTAGLWMSSDARSSTGSQLSRRTASIPTVLRPRLLMLRPLFLQSLVRFPHRCCPAVRWAMRCAAPLYGAASAHGQPAILSLLRPRPQWNHILLRVLARAARGPSHHPPSPVPPPMGRRLTAQLWSCVPPLPSRHFQLRSTPPTLLPCRGCCSHCPHLRNRSSILCCCEVLIEGMG